jgi:hypothetical protein
LVGGGNVTIGGLLLVTFCCAVVCFLKKNSKPSVTNFEEELFQKTLEGLFASVGFNPTGIINV